MEDHRLRRALLVAGCAARRRARPGRGSSAACRAAWPGRCAGGRLRCWAAGRASSPSSSRARSRPPRPPAGRAASRSISACSASVTVGGAGRVQRDRGRAPAASQCAACTTQRAEARSSATVTARVTPTAAARSMAADHVGRVHAAAGVQVGVRVHGRRRQRLRRAAGPAAARRSPARRRCARTAGHGVIGAQDGPVSPSFGSSLVKIGVGLASGRPISIGVDAQRACSAA